MIWSLFASSFFLFGVSLLQVALNSLRTIITGCGDVIRTGSHHRAPIGVDVQAEERHAKCVRLVKIKFSVAMGLWDVLPTFASLNHNDAFLPLTKVMSFTIFFLTFLYFRSNKY